jgi:hypothetical protein
VKRSRVRHGFFGQRAAEIAGRWGTGHTRGGGSAD